MPRLGLRFSTLALGTLFFFVLAGVYTADRILSDSDKAHASVDAVESASLLESFLAVHAEALTAFHGLYPAANVPVRRERFAALVRALGEHVSGFRRIWLTDSSGVVRYEVPIAAGEASLAPGLDLDTVPMLDLRAAAQRARLTRRAQVSRPGTLFGGGGGRGFVVLEPIYVDEQFVGFAGGSVSAAALLASIPSPRARDRLGVVVRAGADTVIASAAASPGPLLRTTAPVRTPGGGSWQVEIVHASTARSVRLALWAAALGVLAALTLGVMHERRQASRIAERSSELERLSSELLRANRAKSEFLANVSHELRTPLNAIVGFVDLLRDGVYGELGPRQIGPVERIEASANHLRHLVDQILDLAKMAAGRLEVHTEILDLRPFVFDVASEVESLVKERGLNFSMAIPASLPRVRTDPTHLRQILVNLLGNAVKYTQDGGIAVRARLVGSAGEVVRQWRPPAEEVQLIRRAPKPDTLWIALQVADSGIGIAAADRERIFDEFEQVNAGPRGDSMRRGTGLGLPISRRLARLIGGDITLESELGKGSTFTLWLPVDAADLRD